MDDPPSVLLVILDLHPLSWAASASSSGDPEDQNGTDTERDTITLDRALNELLVFLNAHLALKWGNELMVYVAMAGGKS
jgi:transcription initiation factor TFIIH subunit 3